MRPRRLGGTSGRPLNFTVRRRPYLALTKSLAFTAMTRCASASLAPSPLWRSSLLGQAFVNSRACNLVGSSSNFRRTFALPRASAAAALAVVAQRGVISRHRSEPYAPRPHGLY